MIDLMIYMLGISSSSVVGGAKLDVDSLATKINSFRGLPSGWHYGSGGPSPRETVDAALRWSDYIRLLGLGDIDAFAGDSGEILLSAIKGDHSIDVIVEVDGKITVAYDRNDVQQSYRSHISATEAQAYVATLARKIWSLSAGYTAIGLTAGGIASPVWLSETPQTMVACQSPNAIVYYLSDTHQETRSVSTLANATWTRAWGQSATRQSSGDSTSRYYRRLE